MLLRVEPITGQLWEQGKLPGGIWATALHDVTLMLQVSRISQVAEVHPLSRQCSLCRLCGHRSARFGGHLDHSSSRGRRKGSLAYSMSHQTKNRRPVERSPCDPVL